MKFVTLCSDDLETKVKSVSSLLNKTIKVLSVDDLVAQMGSVVKPAAGLLYEGARPIQTEAGKQIVVSAEIVFSVLLLSETSVISSKVDMVTNAHLLLDAVREAIHGTRSPTGHFWKWQLEAPAAQKGNAQLWVQRWTTPVQLPPGQKS